MRGIVALALVLALGACERESESPPDRIPMQPASTSKRDEVLALLAKGPVLLYLDARRPGVIVPADHAREWDLVLRIGRDLRPMIPDLVVDDRGVQASLTFHGDAVHCVVPWGAVYGAMLEKAETGTVWSADIPADHPELRTESNPPVVR